MSNKINANNDGNISINKQGSSLPILTEQKTRTSPPKNQNNLTVSPATHQGRHYILKTTQKGKIPRQNLRKGRNQDRTSTRKSFLIE